MDTTFEPTMFGGGNEGWGDNDGQSSQIQQSSTNLFDRVPLPARVKSLVNSHTDDDKFHLGSYAFGVLRVCGKIISKEQKEKEIHLVICDPTDDQDSTQLSVVVYTSNKHTECNEDDIVVAFGKLRKFNGVISLIAFGLVQVEDIRLAEAFNLEADLASRYYTNDIPLRIGQGECPEFAGTMLSNDSTTRNGDNQGGGHQFNPRVDPQVKTDQSYSNISSSVNRGLTGTKQKIYAVIRDNAVGEVGIHVNDIRRLLGQNLSSFDSDLQYLVNEGIVYNSVDDDHYAPI